MAGSIGSIAATLSLNSNAFTKGLSDAAGSVKGFGGGVLAMGGTLAAVEGISNAVTGAISAGWHFVQDGIRNAFDEIDRLSKSSVKLGIGTEALQGMYLAAKLAGVGTESLDTAVVHLQKNISEAAGAIKGTNAAANALASLGLSAAALKQLSPDEQLKQIADRIAAIPNPADKARIAMDLFGKSGAELLPLLNKGGEAFAQAAEESRKFGTALSAVDAAKVEEANHSIIGVQQVFTGFFDQIAVKFAPVITDLATRFTAWATTGGGAVAVVGAAWQKFIEVVAFAGDALSLVEAAFYTLKSAGQAVISSWIEQFALVADGINLIIDGINAIGGDIAKIDTDSLHAKAAAFAQGAAESFDKAQDKIGDFAQGKNSAAVRQWFADVERHARETGAAAVAAGDKLKGMGGAVDEGAISNAKKLDELIQHVEQEAQAIGDARPKLIVEATGLGATADQLERIHKALDTIKAGETQKKISGLLDGLRTKHDELVNGKADTVSGQLQKMGAGDGDLAAAKQLEKENDQLEKQKKILEEIQTPQDKKLAFLKDADELFKSGKLTIDQYTAALAFANNNDQSKGKSGSSRNLEGLDALSFGFQDQQRDKTQTVEEKNSGPMLEELKGIRTDLKGKGKTVATVAAG